MWCHTDENCDEVGLFGQIPVGFAIKILHLIQVYGTRIRSCTRKPLISDLTLCHAISSPLVRVCIMIMPAFFFTCIIHNISEATQTVKVLDVFSIRLTSLSSSIIWARTARSNLSHIEGLLADATSSSQISSNTVTVRSVFKGYERQKYISAVHWSLKLQWCFIEEYIV